MSRSVTAALFDVHGTLVDSNYLHAVTWWEAFIQAGYQVPMADIHRVIGMGSDQMLDALLPPGRDKDGDATHTRRCCPVTSRHHPRRGPRTPR
jgi:beta-phosphoglucomutase-like phosphatase (HAD superfamily)